jgi:hypothetical protein
MHTIPPLHNRHRETTLKIFKHFEPKQLVSEEYCYHMLTSSATTGFGEQPSFGKIHPLQQS